MSEAGEIPAEEPFAAADSNNSGQPEDGEVAETAAGLVDDSQLGEEGSWTAVASTMDGDPSSQPSGEEPASATPEGTLAADVTNGSSNNNNDSAMPEDDGADEEDGEIVEEDSAPSAAEGGSEAMALEDEVQGEEQPAPLVEKKEEEGQQQQQPEDATASLVAPTPSETRDSMGNQVAPENSDELAPTNKDQVMQESDGQDKNNNTTAIDEPPAESFLPNTEAAPESPVKNEAEDGEVEDGEVNTSAPEESSTVGVAELMKPDADAEKKEDETPPTETAMSNDAEEAEPAPMKVEAETPKESEVTTDSSSSVKKEDDKDDGEDNEIKDDTEEEGEIKPVASEEEGEIKDADTEEEGEVKEEDADMEDVSQSDEPGDRDPETASNDADATSMDGDADSVVEDPKKVEPSYSTRGRSSNSGTTTPVPGKGSTAGSASGDSGQWERSVRDALEGLGRNKEAPLSAAGPGGASFLEALGEEERRTRTRYLPAVDGIHMLRKNEIKGDLALSRSIMSNAGNVTSVAAVAGTSTSSGLAKKVKSKKCDAMDIDDGNLSVASEDDRSSDSGRIGSAQIEVEPGDLLTVPSSAFVPPLAATQSIPNGDKKEDGAPPPVSLGVKGILNNQRNIKSPRVIESVTAFQPPRPPESVGKKKQHRMLRWERRPADVEVDLNNYRKTVDRTRKELHTAEDQLERIESTSNHLRRHFMHHLRFMDQEYDKVEKELELAQQQCVIGADLLTSRTRRRGAGKGSQLMRDVLSVLKARGTEANEKGLSLRPATGDSKNHPGIGGVGASSFSDWDQHSVIPSHPIASAWVLPGDKVDTPSGEGTVVKILYAAAPDGEKPHLAGTTVKPSIGQSPSKMDIDAPAGTVANGSPSTAAIAKMEKATASSDDMDTTLCPRVCVNFPFGIGYFSAAAVTSKESPNSYSDTQLFKRWRGLVETSLSQAGQLDLEGMTAPFTRIPETSDPNALSENSAEMPTDAGGSSHRDPAVTKLLPYGSSLLPTGTGRGNILFEMNALDLQKEFKHIFAEGGGVLGDVSTEMFSWAVFIDSFFVSISHLWFSLLFFAVVVFRKQTRAFQRMLRNLKRKSKSHTYYRQRCCIYATSSTAKQKFAFSMKRPVLRQRTARFVSRAL